MTFNLEMRKEMKKKNEKELDENGIPLFMSVGELTNYFDRSENTIRKHIAREGIIKHAETGKYSVSIMEQIMEQARNRDLRNQGY